MRFCRRRRPAAQHRAGSFANGISSSARLQWTNSFPREILIARKLLRIYGARRWAVKACSSQIFSLNHLQQLVFDRLHGLLFRLAPPVCDALTDSHASRNVTCGKNVVFSIISKETPCVPSSKQRVLVPLALSADYISATANHRRAHTPLALGLIHAPYYCQSGGLTQKPIGGQCLPYDFLKNPTVDCRIRFRSVCGSWRVCFWRSSWLALQKAQPSVSRWNPM